MTVERDNKIRGAENTVEAVAKHQAESNQPEKQCCDTKIGDIFDGNVDGIFAAGETRFNAEKSGLHE
jgi:hypothetical protein